MHHAPEHVLQSTSAARVSVTDRLLLDAVVCITCPDPATGKVTRLPLLGCALCYMAAAVTVVLSAIRCTTQCIQNTP